MITLEELEAQIAAPIEVPVTVNDQLLTIPVRLLRPHEVEALELVLAEVHPPVVKGADGRSEFSLDDPEYLKRVARLNKEARALALWWACPIFAAAKDAPAPNSPRAQIFAFVQSKLTEDILVLLYRTARGGELALADRVSFI